MEGTVGIALQSRATYQEGRYCIHFDKNFVFAIFKGTVLQSYGTYFYHHTRK